VKIEAADFLKTLQSICHAARFTTQKAVIFIFTVVRSSDYTLLNSDGRVLPSGIYRRVVRGKSRDVSEEHIASIFRVEE
jgi:hypothetical protein